MRPDARRDSVLEVIYLITFVLLVIYTARIIYHDSHVNSSTYSNRSFALPAGAFSFLITSYFLIRMKVVPATVRIILWPIAFFAAYLIIGLLLIFLNGVL